LVTLLIASVAASFVARAAEPACSIGLKDAAVANAKTVNSMPITPFRRPETGWAIYEPLIANEIGTTCPAASPEFAAALAHWQTAQHLPSTGAMDEATFNALKQAWDRRRPWVWASRHACPEAANEQSLARAALSESYDGKTILLEPEALAAYRRMAEAARKAGLIPARSNLFAIFSGYRNPDADTARCATENNCQSGARATCSAHRTGLALDINLGAAPGSRLDSSDNANRLYLSHTKLYRWMVKNAPHFGFVNYAFEPWHWEFVPASARQVKH